MQSSVSKPVGGSSSSQQTGSGPSGSQPATSNRQSYAQQPQRQWPDACQQSGPNRSKALSLVHESDEVLMMLKSSVSANGCTESRVPSVATVLGEEAPTGGTGDEHVPKEYCTDSCEHAPLGANATESADLPVVRKVCRLHVGAPPSSDPKHGRSVEMPAATEGGMRDDMFFVGIQVQNRWTWAMFDTGASKNLVSTKFFG